MATWKSDRHYKAANTNDQCSLHKDTKAVAFSTSKKNMKKLESAPASMQFECREISNSYYSHLKRHSLTSVTEKTQSPIMSK